jgi:hypothetical protein
MTTTVFKSESQINDKNHKLTLAGFFYKNDTRNGFGSMLSISSDGEVLDISQHTKSYQEQLSLIKKGTHPDFFSIKEWSDVLTNQLDGFISEYYKQSGFSDGLQPLGHYDVDYSNPIVAMIHTLIIDNIYILTQLGTLKNDEYNGVVYHYEKKMTDREISSMLQKMGI